jgi:8-oxo-dGTP pyrophosphatase MutT (NUDIX family)
VASGKQLFRTLAPDTPPKHLVVYFIPVDAAERCLLLGDHRKSGLWLPPGGHVEDGEDPHQAVIREAREELGIEAEFQDENPLFLSVTRTNQVNGHLDVDLWFVLRVARHGTQLNPDPREFKAIRWFGLDEPQHKPQHYPQHEQQHYPQHEQQHEQRDWPADTYDPEMHRFAAKLREKTAEDIRATSGWTNP